jgi:hypothetical protein
VKRARDFADGLVVAGVDSDGEGKEGRATKKGVKVRCVELKEEQG